MRVYEQSVRSLPTTAAPERDALAQGSPRRPHAEVADALPALACIEVGGEARGPGGRSADAVAARVVAWNAERCRDPAAAARLLGALDADALLLSELDQGMARSEQVHTARALAEALGCAYAFGVEFVELGLGDAAEREALAGRSNRLGHHGGAVLSRHGVERPALVRLDAGGDWWDGARAERRVGGRIAVLATLRVGGRAVTLASVHLESHAGPEHRDRQAAALLAALDRYAPGAPALVGGDVNTHGLPLEALEDREVLRRVLAEDASRLRDPVAFEPLFRRFEAAGFEWRGANLREVSTERRKDAPTRRGALKLDWFFARGLECRAPEVAAAVDPASGAPLSDHEAIVVEITPR